MRRKGHVVYKTVKVRHRVRRHMLMPTQIVGQNGALVEQRTRIVVQGCGGRAKSSGSHGQREPHAHHYGGRRSR